MVEYIYYTGVGSKKSGKHNIKEFLNIMNKHFKIQCSEFLPELDYKPCEEYKEIKGKIIQYNIKHNKPIYDFNSSKKTGTKYKKLLNKCNKYKKTAKKRNCNLDEYIKFSGAETQPF
jgi:hypothetical protein